MKKFRKVMSLVLALALVFGLSATAFAADPQPYSSSTDTSFTITVDPAYSGETYTAYKIFDVTYDGDIENDVEATNYSYTIDSSSAWYSTVNAATDVFTLTQVNNSTTYVVTVNDGVNDADIIAVFTNTGVPAGAEAAVSVTAGTVVDETTGESGTTTVTLNVTDSGAGYYYVTTTTGSVVSINTTDPSATIEDKNVPPTVEKNVDDVDAESVENEKAVEYELYIYNVAGIYNVILHDKLNVNEGVTYAFSYDDMTVVLYDNSNDATGTTLVAGTDYVLRTENDANSEIDDECTFEVDLSKYDFSECSSTAFVKVTISCVFDAVGATFEDDELEIPNLGKVTYGNGGSSEWDEANIYEYGFEVYKYTEGDEEEETVPLADAHFSLTTISEDSEELTAYFAVTEDGAYVLEGWGTIPEGNTSYTTDLVSDDTGYILIEGLGVGTFTLTETKAPDGYNLLTNTITVTITAGETDPNNFTVTVDEGTITGHIVMVENNSGTILPGTGGIGTTWFYIIGVILVCGAAVVLVTRRRVNRAA